MRQRLPMRRKGWEIWGGYQDGKIRCSLEICGKPSTNTGFLGWGVDGHEDEIRLENSLVDVGREKQVSSPRLTNDVLQSRLIDRQLEVRAIPSINTGLVQIDNGDLDVRAFEGDDGACGTT
jgi:hypothetical protein